MNYVPLLFPTQNITCIKRNAPNTIINGFIFLGYPPVLPTTQTAVRSVYPKGELIAHEIVPVFPSLPARALLMHTT